MSAKKVVIIGAGVAGLSNAWWLGEIGWEVTVLEKAENLRNSGYMLGLSGPGYSAIEKMGLLETLQKYQYSITSNQYFNVHNKPIFSLDIKKIWGGLNILMLARTDLVNELYQAVCQKKSVAVLFAKEVAQLQNNDNSVTVSLADGEQFEADLVIGADGVHSSIRQQQFCSPQQCEEHLGYKVAAFSMDNDSELSNTFKSYVEPRRVVELYPISDSRAAGLYLWKDSDQEPVKCRAVAKRKLAEQFAHSHPLVSEKIAALEDHEPLLFDTLTMINLPSWSKGRVLLMGDAAHCLTLLSGQGAGIAMTSAYLLAQALKQHDIDTALLIHEAKLRPVVERLQERSRKLAPWFIPASAFGFSLRNFIIKCLPNSVIGWFFLRAVRSDIIAAKIDDTE